MKLSSSMIRKFLLISSLCPQNVSVKNFPILFQKKTHSKNFLVFSQKKLFLYFRKQNVLASRLKNVRKELPSSKTFVIFQEMELSSHKIKNFLKFQEGICKA